MFRDDQHGAQDSSLFPFINGTGFFDITGKNVEKFSVGWFRLEPASCDFKKVFSVSVVPANGDDSADIAFYAGWGGIV